MKRRGFTVVELMVAIVIIAVLAVIISVYVSNLRYKSRLTRVEVDLADTAKAVTQYAMDNNYQYPPDASRDVPPGLEKYLEGGTWPKSIWPHGVFDWDNWIHPQNGQQIYQISYRLCDLDDPIEYCSDPVLFPNFTQQSSIFYCISGPCVPHIDAITAPGYCVNCNPKKQNY